MTYTGTVLCATCCAGHPFGAHAVGDRVVYRGPVRAGIRPGTKVTVIAWLVHAGAQHQEVVAQTRRKTELRCAPCELESEVMQPVPGYESLTREEFRAKLRERHVAVRFIAG